MRLRAASKRLRKPGLPGSSRKADACNDLQPPLWQMVGSATELDHAVYTMDCAVLDKAAHELMIVGDIGGCVQALQLKEHNDPDQNFIVSPRLHRPQPRRQGYEGKLAPRVPGYSTPVA